MTYLNNAMQAYSTTSGQPGSSSLNAISTTFQRRIGQREISIYHDFRKRFYSANKLIECRAGVNPGHVEVLLLSRWLIVFSEARPRSGFRSSRHND